MSGEYSGLQASIVAAGCFTPAAEGPVALVSRFQIASVVRTGVGVYRVTLGQQTDVTARSVVCSYKGDGITFLKVDELAPGADDVVDFIVTDAGEPADGPGSVEFVVCRTSVP